MTYLGSARVRVLAACIVSGWMTAAVGAQQYHIIPAPDGTLGLNDHGVGCGTNIHQGKFAVFIWHLERGVTFLPQPPQAGLSVPAGITNSGHLAVLASAGGTHSFLWTPRNGFTDIGDLPGGIFYSYATAINEADEIVGQSQLYLPYETPFSAAVGQITNQAFLWNKNKGMISIGGLSAVNESSGAYDINDLGHVCGAGVTEKGSTAFLWHKTTGMKAIPPSPAGAHAYAAVGVNNFGQVCGENVLQEAFLWSPEQGYLALGRLPGPTPSTNVVGVNDLGQVLAWGSGDSGNPNKVVSVFLLDATHGVRDLNALLDASSAATGEHLHTGYSINNKGQIIASATQSANSFRVDPFILGDMNCDGVVDSEDLQPFLGQMLKYAGTTPPLFDGEECGWWIGDINQDALLNEDDLAPFLALLP